MQGKFSTRLGFILVSAGCAIGLGNVWRFPYIAGKYGGATFVLFYLLFLAILGLPIVMCELSVGRGSRLSAAGSFDTLEPKGTKWHWYKYPAIAGNVLLMMFYTTISGWMVYYFYKMVTTGFKGMDSTAISNVFGDLLNQPITMAGCMIFTVIICFGVCLMGLRNGVERITKIMMVVLILLMVALAINSLTLPGAIDGLKYYLLPDWNRFVEGGAQEAIFAAMGQAFFTLSIGQGSIAVFGSYIGKEKRLMGEGILIILLDTFVAIVAGLIIFPACFSYGVDPGSGPNLLFVSLPSVFSNMPGGQIWGSLFFLFMIFASFSTVIAIFENLTTCFGELFNLKRNTVIFALIPAIILLSLPCVLGFNIWSDIHPLGGNSGILDLEDFIISNNVLPLGSLVYLTFCTTRYGWGWDNFFEEVNLGTGLKFPAWIRTYMTWGLPVIVLYIFISGYYAMFFK